MTDEQKRWLYLVVTAAPPVLRIAELQELLRAARWRVCVIATPTAASWIDLGALGCPVRVETRPPGEQESLPRADAVIVAPLTFNTINKWAAGHSDNLALGILNEMLGTGVPIVAAPCVKAVLREHPAYRPSLERLRSAGVTFLDSEDVVSRGNDGLATLDWNSIMRAVRATTG